MGKAQDILEKIKVNNAKINRLSKRITVELSSPGYLFINEEKRVCEYFKEHFGTENLEIRCVADNPEIGDSEKRDLVERLIDFCPTLTPYRDDIKIETVNDGISVCMPDVCEPLANATGALRYISEYAVNCLGLDNGASCSIARDEKRSGEYMKLKQEIDNRIIKENGKINVNPSKTPAKAYTKKYSRGKKAVEIKLCDLGNEHDKVVFPCEIISCELRTTRTGRTMIKFDATDFTSSITCLHFTDREKADALMEILKEGSSVIVEGKYSYDKIDRENIVMARKIAPCESVRENRRDNAEKKRTELHLHTKMSAKDGFIEPGQLFKALSEWGHKAVAITDHGVVQAFPDAAYYSKKYGVKAIYGVEGYLVNDGEAIIHNPDDNRFPSEAVVAWGSEDGSIKSTVYKNGSAGEISAHQNAEQLAEAGKDLTVAYLKTGKSDRTIEELALSGMTVVDLATTAKRFRSCRWTGASDEVDGKDNPAVSIFRLIESTVREKGFKSMNEVCVKAAAATVKKNMSRYHVVILAKNKAGLKNLYEMISYSHIDFFYKKPRIPRSILQAKRLNLVIGSACEAGEVYRAAVEKTESAKLEKIASFYDYLEIQPVGNNMFMVREGILENEEAVKNINRKIDDLGRRMGRPVAATCDAHFFDMKDEIYRKIIMHGMKFKDVEFQAPLYMRTTEEMLGEFAYLGEERAYKAVVEAPAAIAESIEEVTPIPRETYPPVLEGSEEELRSICEERLAEIYGETPCDSIRKRLDKELDSIINNGFAVLYVIAQKLAAKSMANGYLVGSRGSVGSSFAAFLAGITEVNPLEAHYICPECKNIEFADPSEYDCGLDMPDKKCPICETPYDKAGFDIPFETFLGFDGTKMPDIDQNFSGEYQAQAHKHVEELFGSDHVFKAGTISTIADKTAYGFVKGYLEENGIPHNKAEINRLVKGCEGVKRTTGQHPGGMVVLPKGYSIHDFTPVQRPADDTASETTTTHFDFNSMHDTLLKLDILGHDDPTVLKMLEDLTGHKAREIDIRDPGIMSLFKSTEALKLKEDISCELGVLGIPEFGTGFVRGMLRTAVPETISELIKLSGLSHGENVWTGNAEDLINNNVATLQEVISIRDNIMLYLMRHGIEPITAFNIMERVRKKSGSLTEEDEKVMRDHKIPGWYIESCKKIEYMFPKAHAAAYVIMALRIAWYKIYHPKEYYTAYFSVRADEFDASTMAGSIEDCRKMMKDLRNRPEGMSAREQNIYTILEIVEEMLARGIGFKPVDIEKSDAGRFRCEKDGIRIPLIGVPGLGMKAAEKVVEERARKPFMSIEDIKNRGKVNKTVMEKLIEMGAVGDLPESSQRSFFQ